MGFINKGKDNHWMAGLGCGIAAIPLIWVGVGWIWVVIRIFALAIAWGGWSRIITNDFAEEYGRGALLALSGLILLI